MYYCIKYYCLTNKLLTLSVLCVFLLVQKWSFAENILLPDSIISDTLRLKSHLKIITKTEKSRNHKNNKTLDFVAGYIYDEFSAYCDSVSFQNYLADGVNYKNVIGSIGTDLPERIILGAHYDVFGEQEGADDNASGIAGILELARLLSKHKLNYRIDFVAYPLEEPPFFRSQYMGSNVHAKMLYENKVKVKGMICLEMIGYFNDEPKSQSYPLGIMSLFYGNRGDFIAVIQKFANRKFGRQFKNLMKKQKCIRTKSFRAPALLPGIDFSDHRNYWKYGFSAVMITNTAFFRNENYHKPSDTLETLDIKRMALVIDQIYLSILNLK